VRVRGVEGNEAEQVSTGASAYTLESEIIPLAARPNKGGHIHSPAAKNAEV